MAVGAVSRPARTSLSINPSQVGSRDFALVSSRSRIPALDGLRGIAILLVLLWHGIFQIQPNSRVLARLLTLGSLSWSGVDLFFVLSGFLIGGILLDARNSSRYFQTFYLRRAYRILPLYGVLVLAQVVTRLSFLPGWIAQSATDPVPLWSYLTFTQNIRMAVIAGFGSLVMSATWSLAIEEQFYLTSPFLVRKLNNSALVRVLLVIILAASLLRAFLYFRFHHGGFASYVLMPCRADDLCLGVLVAMLMRDQRIWPRLLASRRRIYALTGILVLPLVYFSWQHYGPYSQPMVIAGFSLLGLFYTGCLFAAITADGKVRRVLCNRRLIQLGSLAYCTYLFHLPLIEFCDRLLRRRSPSAGPMTDVVAGVFGITLTLILAAVSWKYFETPLLRRGHAHKY